MGTEPVISARPQYEILGQSQGGTRLTQKPRWTPNIPVGKKRASLPSRNKTHEFPTTYPKNPSPPFPFPNPPQKSHRAPAGRSVFRTSLEPSFRNVHWRPNDAGDQLSSQPREQIHRRLLNPAGTLSRYTRSMVRRRKQGGTPEEFGSYTGTGSPDPKKKNKNRKKPRLGRFLDSERRFGLQCGTYHRTRYSTQPKQAQKIQW